MTAKELRAYTGKRIRFESDRTRRWVNPTMWGIVREVRGREADIGGDWHTIKTVVVHEVAES